MKPKKKILYSDPAAAQVYHPTRDDMFEEDIAQVRELPEVKVTDTKEDSPLPPPKEERPTWTLFGITWPRGRWVLTLGGTAAVLAALAVAAFRHR